MKLFHCPKLPRSDDEIKMPFSIPWVNGSNYSEELDSMSGKPEEHLLMALEGCEFLGKEGIEQAEKVRKFLNTKTSNVIENKPELHICIGPSRAGKSTYSKKWLKEPSLFPRVVVDTDIIRKALTGQEYIRELETVVFAHKHVMIKTLLMSGYTVLSCGTNTTKESLKRLLEIEKDAIPIVFDTSLDVCIERAKMNKQDYLIPVITRHRRQLDALLEQGIDNVFDEIRNSLEVRWGK